jgi:outer membrane murein-binding lipoprotein Lpp
MYKIVRLELNLETNQLSERVVQVYESLQAARTAAQRLNRAVEKESDKKAQGFQVQTD